MYLLIVIASLILLAGIAYVISCFHSAEVEKDVIDINQVENILKKPDGWKVGKMPQDLKPLQRYRPARRKAIKTQENRFILSRLFTLFQRKTKNVNIEA